MTWLVASTSGCNSRGDVGAHQALQEINHTVERATLLANQMLALAKVEQLRQQPDAQALDLSDIVRAVALDLSPLVAQKNLDFEIHTVSALVLAHDWMLRELSRNLLHNAIKHAPTCSALSVRLAVTTGHAVLCVSDAGTGIPAELRSRLFQPFSAGTSHSGSGLGLTICLEICQTLGGVVELVNRPAAGNVAGLDAIVRLPLADATTEAHGQGSH